MFGPQFAVAALMNEEEGRTALELLANLENGVVAGSGQDWRLDPNEIRPSLYDLSLYPENYAVVVVRMPPAREPAEAHLIGVVIKSLREDDNSEADLLYFSLEKMASSGAYPRTCIGEWKVSGARKNHGQGPREDQEAEFVEYIGRIIGAGLWDWE